MLAHLLPTKTCAPRKIKMPTPTLGYLDMLVLSDYAEMRLLARALGFFMPVMSRGGQLAHLSVFSPAAGSTQRLAEQVQVVGSLKGHRGACARVQGQ